MNEKQAIGRFGVGQKSKCFVIDNNWHVIGWIWNVAHSVEWCCILCLLVYNLMNTYVIKVFVQVGQLLFLFHGKFFDVAVFFFGRLGKRAISLSSIQCLSIFFFFSIISSMAFMCQSTFNNSNFWAEFNSYFNDKSFPGMSDLWLKHFRFVKFHVKENKRMAKRRKYCFDFAETG